MRRALQRYMSCIDSPGFPPTTSNQGLPRTVVSTHHSFFNLPDVSYSSSTAEILVEFLLALAMWGSSIYKKKKKHDKHIPGTYMYTLVCMYVSWFSQGIRAGDIVQHHIPLPARSSPAFMVVGG